MLASPTLVQQTQLRLAEHYLKKLQQASTAIGQTSTGTRDYWIGVVQQDWSQIKRWRDWSATEAEQERARLCVEFCTTTTRATATQETTVETISNLKRGLKAARLLDDRANEGEILYMLGLNHMRLQQINEARSCADDLLDCGDALQNNRMRGRAWYLHASISFASGSFDEALTKYTRSQKLLEKLEPREMVSVWAGFGHIAYFQGHYQASYDYHTRSMQQALQVDDEPNVAVAHLSLTGVCLQLKQMEEAVHHAQETLRIARKLSYLPLIPHALTMLAGVNRQLGRLDEARGNYEEVLGTTRATLSPDSIASALTGLGRVYALQGDEDAAITRFAEALTIAHDNNIAFRIPTPAEELVHIHLKRGDITQARVYLKDLLSSANALQSERFYAKTLFAAASLYHADGQSERAAQWIGLLQRYTEHLNARAFARLTDNLPDILGEQRYEQLTQEGDSMTLAVVAQGLSDEFEL